MQAMTKTARAYALRRRLNVLLHRWHRRIGVTASVFLIWMAISGWLLNHTASFDLARRNLTSDFVTAHYGIRSEIPEQAFVAGEHWLVVSDGAAVLDGKKIAIALSQSRGMIEKDNILFVADAVELTLLDGRGELIDKVSTPIAIERIGTGCDGVVIANSEKQLVTKDGVTFSDCADAVQPAREEKLTAARRAELTPLLRSGVTLERVLLDLHSGRFFGTWGPYFVDAIGFGLIALALSGLWLFARQGSRRRQQLHRH